MNTINSLTNGFVLLGVKLAIIKSGALQKILYAFSLFVSFNSTIAFVKSAFAFIVCHPALTHLYVKLLLKEAFIPNE